MRNKACLFENQIFQRLTLSAHLFGKFFPMPGFEKCRLTEGREIWYNSIDNGVVVGGSLHIFVAEVFHPDSE